MTDKHTKECVCENCGSEAEMTIVCNDPEKTKEVIDARKNKKEKVEAKMVCNSCGNEADIWVEQ